MRNKRRRIQGLIASLANEAKGVQACTSGHVKTEAANELCEDIVYPEGEGPPVLRNEEEFRHEMCPSSKTFEPPEDAPNLQEADIPMSENSRSRSPTPISTPVRGEKRTSSDCDESFDGTTSKAHHISELDDITNMMRCSDGTPTIDDTALALMSDDDSSSQIVDRKRVKLTET